MTTPAEGSQLRQRPGDQQLPTPNDGPSMHDLVVADLRAWTLPEEVRTRAVELLEARKQLGLTRYGSLLQAHNGRDARRDLVEEIVDALVYARQLIEEQGLPGSTAYPAARAYQRLMSALVWAMQVPGGDLR